MPAHSRFAPSSARSIQSPAPSAASALSSSSSSPIECVVHCDDTLVSYPSQIGYVRNRYGWSIRTQQGTNGPGSNPRRPCVWIQSIATTTNMLAAVRNPSELKSHVLRASTCWVRSLSTAAPATESARHPTALGLKPRTISLGKVPVDVKSAVVKSKELSRRKFDETVDIAIQLGVDPRKPNQSVRGVVALPNGTGKTVRVAVFARGVKAEEAKAAGAAIVGAEDLVEMVQKGQLDFDRCIATPDVMPLVGRVARILGPRGLMPNPKLGTVTVDVADAIAAAQAGQVEFRAEKKGIVHAGVGKVSFSEEALLENIRAFMVALSDAKPEGAKGKYIKAAHLSTTMGPGIALDIKYLDPSSAQFMRFD